MNTVILNGALYARMIEGAAANLYRHRTIVNDLNVFPIPDGDTGDNMYMTIHAGWTALEGKETASVSEVALAASKGMLLGARGNSGVILSRIFAGIAKGLGDLCEADPAQMGKAFDRGVQEAYSAVATPVEGTILTVYRDAVACANQTIAEGNGLETWFAAFLEELRASLERTPELLPVLKEAGVVDSGGAGFVYIAEGMDNALHGVSERVEAPAAQQKAAVDPDAFTENDVLAFGYCTEFLLRITSSKVGDVRAFDERVITDYLNREGESVVAFRDGSILKVHVHTMCPGKILTFVQDYGEFLTMKIENMMLQHESTTIQNAYEPKKKRLHKPYAIVTVATGEGLKETFAALGADVIIDGGQSMNPSAQDFLDAFDSVDADTILVFPNNSNIVLTAEQAAAMYEGADVRVIRDKSVGDGYAALSVLDTDSGDTDQILSAIYEVIESTVTGEVSRAVRETVKDGVAVHTNDYIGFAGGRVYCDAESAEAAALALAGALEAGAYDICLLLVGKEPAAEKAEALYEALSKAYPRTEFIMVNGGQPIYDYILVLE